MKQNFCGLGNYTLAWWHMPPFISCPEDHLGQEVSRLDGIMMAAIRNATALCCRDIFNQDTFSHPVEYVQYASQEFMLNNITHKNTLAVPVIIPSAVAAMKPTGYFIRVVDSSGMVHVGRPGEPITHVLVEALISIWPLLAALLILTGYSAIILWLMHLGHHHHKGDDKIRSLFDWYWFSFITAATVGYGDKVPTGIISKCFTMVWAVLGISVMAGTTATLTTLLSEHQQSVARLPSIKGETVGVLAGSVERRFVAQQGGIPKEFGVNDMRNSLLNGSIDHAAVDHYSFHHYFNSSTLNNLKYEIVETPEITIGYILFLPDHRDFIDCLRLRSFLAELSVDSLLIKNIGHEKFSDLTDDKNVLQNTADSLFSSGLKLTVLLLGVVCVSVTATIAICHVIAESKCRKQQQQLKQKNAIEEKPETGLVANSNNTYTSLPMPCS